MNQESAKIDKILNKFSEQTESDEAEMNEAGKVENSQSKLRKFPPDFSVVFSQISTLPRPPLHLFNFEALRCTA